MNTWQNIKRIAGYWWVVLLAMVAAAASVLVVDTVRKPEYSGYARVLVRPSNQLSDTRILVDLLGQVGYRYVTGTFAQTFTSEQVKTAARQAAGLSTQEADSYPLEANVLPDTVVIEVSGKGPDRQVLTRYLDATVKATVDQTHTVFGVVELEPMEPAKVPSTPSSPQPVRDAVLGMALGFLFGFLLAWTFASLRAVREEQRESAGRHAFLAAQAEWDEKMRSTHIGSGT